MTERATEPRLLTLPELHKTLLGNASFWVHVIDLKLPFSDDDWRMMRDDWEGVHALLRVMDP